MRYNHFKEQNPELEKDVVQYTILNDYEMWIRLNDRSEYIYNTIDNTLLDLNNFDNETDFRIRVKYTMKRLKMSRKSFSTRTGININKIRKYLNDEIRLNETELEKIAEICGIPLK